MVCRLFYIVRLFVYQIEAAEKPPEKEIFKTIQNNDLSLWYIITYSSAILGAFCFLMLFFTDLGRLAENAFDARKLYFVFAAVLIPCKCHQIFKQE
jgi:putative membrane protein